MINITGIDKAAVLAALYNAAHPIGMGFLRFTSQDITPDEARLLLVQGDDHGNTTGYFDYLNGRVMKVDLSKDEFDPWLYDRDNGPDAALNALKEAGLL